MNTAIVLAELNDAAQRSLAAQQRMLKIVVVGVAAAMVVLVVWRWRSSMRQWKESLGGEPSARETKVVRSQRRVVVGSMLLMLVFGVGAVFFRPLRDADGWIGDHYWYILPVLAPLVIWWTWRRMKFAAGSAEDRFGELGLEIVETPGFGWRPGGVSARGPLQLAGSVAGMPVTATIDGGVAGIRSRMEVAAPQPLSFSATGRRKRWTATGGQLPAVMLTMPTGEGDVTVTVGAAGLVIERRLPTGSVTDGLQHLRSDLVIADRLISATRPATAMPAV